MSEFELSQQPLTPESDPFSTSQISAVTREELNAPVKLRGLDADDLAAIEALPAASALLIARIGPNAGARFLLNSDTTTAGRSPKSDIFLDDVTVSRAHAEFEREGATFMVRDLGSLNGTYVNGEIVDTAPLKHHDEVRIGKYRFTFFASAQVA